MQTEPPPRANFCETVNQWVIYDSYVTYETAKVRVPTLSMSSSVIKDETAKVRDPASSRILPR